MGEGDYELAERLVERLRQCMQPVTAIELARFLELGGGREWQRRKVRRLVQIARNGGGHAICANLAEGYWKARSGVEWDEYCDAVKRNTCFKFVEMRRCQEAVTDAANEQGQLFDVGGRSEERRGSDVTHLKSSYFREESHAT